MKVSLNIVKQLTGVELPEVGVLVERINQRLGGVEEMIDLREKYKDAKIVRVVECEKHPDADKLSVCKIDVGEDELVQVVCGAPNARAGMFAIWLPPNSTVPSTFGASEPFVLDARKLRGVMSYGMLAAADELGIGTDHSGIIEITEKDLSPISARHPELDSGSSDNESITSQLSSSGSFRGSSKELANYQLDYPNKSGNDNLKSGDRAMSGVQDDSRLQPGMSFAKVFGLDDVIIDIENKMFTHRPDLFGQLGVAREINAILQDLAENNEDTGSQFENPDWYWSEPKFENAEGLKLEVFNDTPEASPRFMAVAIKDVKITESPLWLKCQLVAMGSKPINNIVDWTNYMMLMTAQPTHAYDYDKLRGQKIGVRMAKEGEKIKLLNDKAYELTSEDIVIADGEGAIGLAGVMGGFDSEVTSETKNIVLEVANFNMYKVRKTSMRYGLFTDAVTRFNKGQSPLQVDRVTRRLIDMLPGEQASPVFDLPNKSHDNSVHGEVKYSADFVNQRLGTDFTASQMRNILQSTNIAASISNNDPNLLSSTAPFWRTDIAIPEDIVEEVGRLYGFDNLKRELPLRSSKPAPKNSTRQIKQRIRESLAKSGANEVLSYSFVHENVLKRAGQDPSQAFRLSNALSPDLQYFRLEVLPSLLDKIHANIKAGHDEFALFEIGKGHYKDGLDSDGLPDEYSSVAIVYANKRSQAGAAYYQLRRLVDKLAADLKLEISYKPITEGRNYANTSPFDLSRTAFVETVSGIALGYIGELKQQVRRDFKLPDYAAAATFDLDTLKQSAELAGKQTSYKPLSRYPSVTQDVSLKVSSQDNYQDTVKKVSQGLENIDKNLRIDISPVTIYQAPEDNSSKTITLRLKFTHSQKTLEDKEVSRLIDKVARG